MSAAEARIRLADGNWLVVVGYFDPLTASLADRLHRLVKRGHENVLSVVLNRSETLLGVADRSFLMAALRDVDAVVAISDSELRGFLPSEPRIRFVFDLLNDPPTTE